MDTIELPPKEMETTLQFLEFTNRYFGGIQILLTFLQRWTLSWDKSKTIRVLDVGTGSADIPRAIVQWARSNTFSIKMTGIDLVPGIVTLAQKKTRDFSEIEIRQINAMELAAQGETFDFVIGSLLLHHVPEPEWIPLLKTFDQLASRGIILSDLLRSWPSLAAVTVASYVFGNHVVRHDGPASVRRSFTPDELSALVTQADLPYLRVNREPWFRLSLAGEKP
jgi:2-polyprenyl-3-methyl-5-hydroxy-6-metoxy-1,4-benzoquinol methylase